MTASVTSAAVERLPFVHGVPSVTAAQMAEVDRITTTDLSVGVDLLMENASRQIAAAARALLGGTVAGRHIIGLIGSGNNGGDTAGALRHLVNWGARVLGLQSAPQQRQRDLTRMQVARLLMATDHTRAIVKDATRMRDHTLPAADLVLDGLLGYGSRGAPRETAALLIEAANASRIPILAVDIPSGVDPDSGSRAAPAIRAATTVTLALPKSGLMAAQDVSGTLLLADIGIPHEAFARIGVRTTHLFDDADLVRVQR
jgi:hydroxyethylthiazole kinase-like uncharacterized protein yjeF